MNTDLGTAFVALGLTASLLAVGNQIYGLIVKRSDLLSRVQIPVLIMFVAALGQVAVMERALITRDFTVAYVAQHGSTRTPALFNVATLWSALEGSILLWVLILVGYLGLVVWRFKSRLEDPLVAWAITVISIVCVFFFILLFVYYFLYLVIEKLHMCVYRCMSCFWVNYINHPAISPSRNFYSTNISISN